MSFLNRLLNKHRPKASVDGFCGVAIVTADKAEVGGLVSFFEHWGFVTLRVLSSSEVAQHLNNPSWTPVVACATAKAAGELVDLGVFRRLVQRSAAICIDGKVKDSVLDELGLTRKSVVPNELDAANVVSGRLREQLGGLLAGYSSGDSLSLKAMACRGYVVQVVAGERNRKVPADSNGSLESIPAMISTALEGVDEVVLSNPHTLLARKDRVLIAEFSLLKLISSRFQAPELQYPLLDVSGERNGEGLELLVLLSLSAIARSSGRPLVSIEPWPNGVSSVLTVRHDVDRPLQAEDWRRLLNWHTANRIVPSWYYLKSTINYDRIAESIGSNHEIGLHYTNLQKAGESEHEELQRAVAAAGGELVGATCHGGNFHGATDLVWLSERGYKYAEMLTRCGFYPHRCSLGSSPLGRSKFDSMWVTARHLSVDRTMSPPTSDFRYGARTMATRHRLRGHVVVMNHPDINFAAMCDAVRLSATPGQESWSQAQVLDWWSATHDSRKPIFTSYYDDRVLRLELLEELERAVVLRVWARLPSDTVERNGVFGEEHSLVQLGESRHVSLTVAQQLN